MSVGLLCVCGLEKRVDAGIGKGDGRAARTAHRLEHAHDMHAPEAEAGGAQSARELV